MWKSCLFCFRHSDMWFDDNSKYYFIKDYLGPSELYHNTCGISKWLVSYKLVTKEPINYTISTFWFHLRLSMERLKGVSIIYDECRNCIYQYLVKCFWTQYLESLCMYQQVFKCFPLTLHLEPLSMKWLKEISIIYIGEVP